MDHYGIGQAMDGVAKIYFQSSRRTGRTTSLIESVKNGDTVVFTNQCEAKRVKALCKEKGIIINTAIVNPEKPNQVYDVVRDNKGRTVFDHSWVEQYYMNALKIASCHIDNLQNVNSCLGMPIVETERQIMEMQKWRR
jgi:hypothetical protein